MCVSCKSKASSKENKDGKEKLKERGNPESNLKPEGKAEHRMTTVLGPIAVFPSRKDKIEKWEIMVIQKCRSYARIP